ncbi:hypothetical protein PAMA_004560 [Pampus argenteus]
MNADPQQTLRSLLVSERSSFLEEKNRLIAQAQEHHLNYKVSVLLPECSSAPSHLDEVLKSFSTFYLIKNLPLYELLGKEFLEAAVYQGSVYGLSYRSRIDEENCIALTANGRLSLSLDKDSYELLGVEGKPLRCTHRTSNRFVSVNLTDSSMAPGGRGYQRLLAGLTSCVQLRTDFLLSHHPGSGAALQSLLSRYDWSEHSPEVSSRSMTHLSCPTLLTSDLQTCDPHSFLEWLGAMDADVSCENLSSSFLSSLVCPEPMTAVSQLLSISISGLLLPQDIQRLIQELRCYLEQSRLASWVVLTVHGFIDSPVSWSDSEHHVLTGGENFYTLLLFHDHTYRLHMATRAPHTCPP